ncbi:MAG: GNAT family N-acetyltransferase [Actinobacteria bacterium]|nr:MAG: GNAT family N-acetyltransferase [Actinomycetota bacterium]
MERVFFHDVPRERWDEWVASVPEATHLHSSDFITYLERSYPDAKPLSFALVDERGVAQAICPMAVGRIEHAGIGFVDASFSGEPLGAPAVRRDSPSSARRAQAEAYAALHALAAEHGAARALLRRHPLSIGVMGGADSGIDAFAPLLEGYQAQPQNTIVIDLALPEDTLTAELSKYHRRHINRSRRDGVTVERFSGEGAATDEMFAGYRRAHFLAAGRVTRPEPSFEWMRCLLAEERASLFVAFVGGQPASFLFCGAFHGLVFGWSQANLEEFTREQPPRHLLEWEAILDSRARGARFYELGINWSAAQPYYAPSDKERSIAEFKRRYGGRLMPEIAFERVFDSALWERLESARAARFLESDAFDASEPAGDDE